MKIRSVGADLLLAHRNTGRYGKQCRHLSQFSRKAKNTTPLNVS